MPCNKFVLVSKVENNPFWNRPNLGLCFLLVSLNINWRANGSFEICKTSKNVEMKGLGRVRQS